MLWSNKKEIKSDEYETLSKKMTTLEGSIVTMAAHFTKLEMQVNNLRGIMNRKLSGIVDEGRSDSQQDLNMLVPLGIGNGKILGP